MCINMLVRMGLYIVCFVCFFQYISPSESGCVGREERTCMSFLLLLACKVKDNKTLHTMILRQNDTIINHLAGFMTIKVRLWLFFIRLRSNAAVQSVSCQNHLCTISSDNWESVRICRRFLRCSVPFAECRAGCLPGVCL